MDIVQELFNRRATFASLNPRNPLSGDHPTMVVVTLSHEEAEELRKISFERQTQELSERRCDSCSIGLIVKQKRSVNGRYALRYSCTCDGDPPINQEDWVPIAESSQAPIA